MAQTLLAALLVWLPLGAEGARAEHPASPAPPATRVPQRLDLGLYGAPYASRGPGREPDLRFEDEVDVVGEAKPGPNEAMAFWWKRFGFVEPSVYGRDYNLRPNAQPNSVNLMPLFEKLYDKLKKRK